MQLLKNKIKTLSVVCSIFSILAVITPSISKADQLINKLFPNTINPINQAAQAKSPPQNSDLVTYLYYISELLYYNFRPVILDIDTQVTASLNAFNAALVSPDTTDATANTQSAFNTYATAASTNATTQTNIQQNLMNDLFAAPNTPYQNATTNVNDYTFSTLLGKQYLTNDPRKNPLTILSGRRPLTDRDIAYNYLKNISGIHVSHISPDDSWKGSDYDKQKYTNFYTTIMAAQTYNAYISSELYAEFVNGNSFTASEDNLIKQASDPTWFANIASETISVVLRQLLMYTSQQLVISSELLKSQREMSASLAMTNTLLILGNQFNETMLLHNAQAKQTIPGM